ncbi:hypothetical protein [Cysteiniphilum halobium]|uniref:hypothetical protein n=1 Tax=Cysteiniphilum halobium TaxID=2219059 RepID=UPI000E658B40|nr:hypothetical protein [Cysteiniphilum halobium]
MSTIFHEGHQVLVQHIGNNNQATIADLLYFRITGSSYQENGEAFFLMPNINHLVKYTNLSKRVCQRALIALEKNDWIKRIKTRCLDGAVRTKVFITDKLKKAMLAIDNLKTSKVVANSPKTSVKPSFYADCAKMALSDSAKLAKSYIKEKKGKEINNTQDSLLEDYSFAAHENYLTVKTVIFNFSKYDLGDFTCESAINNELTARQKEAVYIIILNNTNTIDLNVFREAITNKENKAHASDFKHLVSLAYREAKNAKRIKLETEMIASDLSVDECYSIDYSASVCEYDYLEDQSNAEALAVGAERNINNTNTENNNDSKTSSAVIPDIDEVRAIIQAKHSLVAQDGAIEAIETVTLDDGAINETNHIDTVVETENSVDALEFQEENHVIPERIENVVEAMQAAGYIDTDKVVKTAQEVLINEPEIGFRDLFDAVHYLLVKVPLKSANGGKNKLLSALWADRENPEVNLTQSFKQQGSVPTLADIEMPKVSDTRLRHDLASEAEQVFFSSKLPYSQTVALVGIIDYVKRQGVVIGSDKEVYQWLYHMASNKDYYYSNALNFKHWCNIAMSQLRQRRLHRPTGFGKWLAMVEKQEVATVA